MLKIFSKIFFILILIFLISSFFGMCNTEAKSKVKLSKKYIPSANPGGENFYADEDFAESYKLYEKRREILKKKKLQDQANQHVNKEDLIRKLKEKKIASLYNRKNDVGAACMVEDEDNHSMINKYGINLACLKGAVFIDQELVSCYENKQNKSEQQKKEKVSSIQEKKIPPINISVKDSPSRISAHDFITDLNRLSQYSLNGLSSFANIADALKYYYNVGD